MATMKGDSSVHLPAASSSTVKAASYEPAFGEMCLFCMTPVARGSVYCSDECEADDKSTARGPHTDAGADYSPVPPLEPAGGSSSCSSTPSSANNSPHHDPLIAHGEEPSQLALPPSLTAKPPVSHFNYRYSYGGSPKDDHHHHHSPPFGVSSDGRTSSHSSASETAHSYSRTLSAHTFMPSTAPPLTLVPRRTSLVSPRLRPIGHSPHTSPALRPLTTLSHLSLQRPRTDSPQLLPRSVGAPPMARRSSVPLEATIESDNEADDEANPSAFAHFLFEKSRRASEMDAGHRLHGTVAPATSPTSRSHSRPPTQPPRNYLFGRASPSTDTAPPTAPVVDPQQEQQQPEPRGRSRQRHPGSSAYRSLSPKSRARSGSPDQSSSPSLLESIERGRRGQRRPSEFPVDDLFPLIRSAQRSAPA